MEIEEQQRMWRALVDTSETVVRLEKIVERLACKVEAAWEDGWERFDNLERDFNRMAERVEQLEEEAKWEAMRIDALSKEVP